MRWLLLPLLLVSCAAEGVASPALRLEFEGGTCSGTAVGAHLVLTAAHCFEAGRLVSINGTPAYALRRVDDGQDHSLVKVSIRLRAPVSGRAEPVQGAAVRWIGNPAGMPNIVRQGYVAGRDEDEWLIAASSFGGDSGAGVFDSRGRLVAVVSGVKWWKRGDYVFSFTYAKPLAFSAEDWRRAGADS